MQNKQQTIEEHLSSLYGQQRGADAAQRLADLLDRFRPTLVQRPNGRFNGQLNEADAILITYGDQVRQPGVPPLQTLADFASRHLTGIISGIHILPFYPYTSDDGFSVVDYQAVDPALGDWSDVERAGQNFALMFDAVINHISASSAWFQGFLKDDPRYREYFIAVTGNPDLSAVVRPRALPLLTQFETASGLKSVWTTFSDDQIDLNYANPAVLLDVIDTLLFYVCRGAELIRLDAIAYLWKKIGTSSIHLEETHRVIQLIRAVLDQVAPHVMLVTETNVPHQDNISYFGDGYNEAQMVYNFALPPLILYTFLTGSVLPLNEWAATLTLPSDRTTFFNFLASHDGIGLNPARGILHPSGIDHLVKTVEERGGLVSYKHNPDGTQSPYELNISYLDALTAPEAGESLALQADRFAAAHAIQMALVGVPGIYFHSLFGSRNWMEGVAQTGRSRTINRQKLELAGLERDLADPGSLRSLVFQRMKRLLTARAASPAFDPYGRQIIVQNNPGVFTLWRIGRDHRQRVLCLQNVNTTAMTARVAEVAGRTMQDLISGAAVQVGAQGEIALPPYGVYWLTTLPPG